MVLYNIIDLLARVYLPTMDWSSISIVVVSKIFAKISYQYLDSIKSLQNTVCYVRQHFRAALPTDFSSII